jgi:hypothetical protein
MTADDILIFGGSGSPKLTLKICEYLHVRPGAREVLRFSEGNLFVRVPGKRAWTPRLPRAVDGLSCQRSFHGTSLLG